MPCMACAVTAQCSGTALRSARVLQRQPSHQCGRLQWFCNAMPMCALFCLPLLQLYPLKRLATPEDVAWAVCWLVHPKTTFTTGAAIPVDGGLSLVQTTGLAMAKTK